MNVQDIQNYIKKIFAGIRKGDVVQRSMIQPKRDWKLLLLFFVVLSSVILLFSTYFFLQINKGEIFLIEPTSSATVNIIDTQLLDETLLFLSEKASTFEDIKNKKPTLPDPSI